MKINNQKYPVLHKILAADSNPSQYKTPDKFTAPELLAAIRQDIIAELDAVNLYEAHAAATDDPDFKMILEHIINEEKQHAKELKEFLDKLDATELTVDPGLAPALDPVAIPAPLPELPGDQVEPMDQIDQIIVLPV